MIPSRLTTLTTIKEQAGRAEKTSAINRLVAAAAAAGAIIAAECFEGTVSDIVSGVLAGVAIHSGLESIHASLVDGQLRGALVSEIITIRPTE